eukprot:jgi/Chlat1/5897/Chrsp4S06398
MAALSALQLAPLVFQGSTSAQKGRPLSKRRAVRLQARSAQQHHTVVAATATKQEQKTHLDSESSSVAAASKPERATWRVEAERSECSGEGAAPVQTPEANGATWKVVEEAQEPEGLVAEGETSASREVLAAVGSSKDTPVLEQSGAAGGGKSLWDLLPFKLSPRMRGLVLINAMTMLYGTNMVVIKSSEMGLDANLFSFGRFAIAALAFTPFLPKAMEDKRIRNAGLELGTWAALAYGAQAVGLLTCEASRASFISTFTVIVVPFLSAFLGRKIPFVTYISAVAALTGVSFLETSGAPPSVGDAWTVLSAVLFAWHIIRSEHHSKVLAGANTTGLIGIQLGVIAALSGVWVAAGPAAHSQLDSLVSGGLPGLISAAQHAPWLAMIYTGLISTAFCLWTEMAALRDVTATDAALIYTAEPVYGAALAYLVLGERWGERGWLGAALILGASVAAQIFGQEETPGGGSCESSSDVATSKTSQQNDSPNVLHSELHGHGFNPRFADAYAALIIADVALSLMLASGNDEMATTAAAALGAVIEQLG